MSCLAYQTGGLYMAGVPLSRVAEQFGTPAYVYSRAAIEQAWCDYDDALAARRHLICYAVKANSNLAVLNVLARRGSGFDVVSGGELERVLLAGGDPGKVVFSGVGKTTAEIERAVAVGIKCFNVESVAELERIEECAGRQDKVVPVSLRVNPNIDPLTHPYIATGLRENKFGINHEQAIEAYEFAVSLPHLSVEGVGCHIGSQISSLGPFLEAATRLKELIQLLVARGINIRHIDVGGGLAVSYQEEPVPTVRQYVTALLEIIPDRNYEIIVEPGRSIVAEAGVLLTRVEYLKHAGERAFAIVDAAMNDLVRPALYGGWHGVLPLREEGQRQSRCYDLVGPVCESGDFLARNRSLALEQGDLLAITVSGAYGFVMSSNYNTRPRAPEIMVDGNALHQIRAREALSDLVARETLLPEEN